MKIRHFLLILLLLPAVVSHAQWQVVTKDLIYSPRYFGPSAFPYPDAQEGLIRDHIELEARVEYHHYAKGDRTWDCLVRGYLPLKQVAALEVTYIPKEHYRYTPAVRDERHAVELKLPSHEKYSGDVVISSYFQLLRNAKWLDMVAGIHLKTASGGRVCDARFTDAAGYWFDLHLGRNVWTSADRSATLRAHLLGGFYCWMTNDIVHRQNDAILYGGGVTGRWKGATLTADCVGFHGYKKNGDSPLSLSLRVEYAVRRMNIFSFRFRHGLCDNLYDSCSLAYIRKF